MKDLSTESNHDRGTALEIHSGSSSSAEESEHTHISSNSPSDCDSWLSSDDHGVQPVSQKFPVRAKPPKILREINHEHHRRLHERNQFQGVSGEISQKAWYELDFAVLLALIPPFGNWLTGGDHLKNLVFIALLVFYLHQIIEAPWRLYQKARRRGRPSNLPAVTSEDRYRELAISELRKLELLCLVLTTVSPFVGVYILQYATQSIMGPEFTSWFNTVFFVMATGVRPWSHLIERLSQRTVDLQNFIHDPPTKFDDELREGFNSLAKRVDALEASVSRIRGRIKYKSEGVLNHFDDAIASIRRSLRKHDKQSTSQEERLHSLEKSIRRPAAPTWDTGESSLMMIPGITATAARSVFNHVVPKRLLYNGRQSGKGRDRYETQRSSKFQSNGSMISVELEAIGEEDHGGNHLLQDKPLYFVTKLLHGVGHLVFMPIRVALRVFLKICS